MTSKPRRRPARPGSPATHPLDGLIDALVGARQGLDPTRDELADALWLGARIAAMEQADQRARKSLGAVRAPEMEQAPETEGEASPEPPRKPGRDGSGSERETEVYAYRRRPASGAGVGKGPGQASGAGPVRIPGAPALPGSLALGRALKPLGRRVPSRTALVLDEAGTAQRIADEGLWVPVYRPASERWLELALVVDASPSMLVWEPAITELRRLLAHHRAFSDVRLWRVEAKGPDASESAFERQRRPPRLVVRDESGRLRDPLELREATGRRVVWLLSDCVAPYWRHNDDLIRLIALWSERNPLALVHMLPPRIWSRSGIAGQPRLRLRARRPGIPNRHMSAPVPCPRGTLPLPVLTLDPRSLSDWARVTAGHATGSVTGIGLDARYQPAPEPGPPAMDPTRAVQRLRAFRARAAPEAQQLAEVFATIPLTLPIMRLAQQTLLPASRLTHLAELFLSGLLGRADRDLDLDLDPPKTDPMQVPFDFLPGVRDVLLADLPEERVATWSRRMTEVVEQRFGHGIEFLALVGDPNAVAGPGIDANAIAFARMRAKVLRRLGGDFADWAEALERMVGEWEKARIGTGSTPPTQPTPFRDPFRDGSGGGPEMVWLPGGSFRMGSPEGVGDEDEHPAHQVTLGHYGVGKCPVTVGEFRRFVEATGYRTEAEQGDGAYVWSKGYEKVKDASWRKPYLEQDDRHPVVCIGWNDARAYCDWLSKQTGRAYGLLTEAQWEHACRAGSQTAFCFGDDPAKLGEYAWYGENSEENTHVVGGKKANAWGLHDMHGNAWEWCSDWHGSYAADVQQDPAGPARGSFRVVRGGAWNNDAVLCRSAYRVRRHPAGRNDRLGFRLSRTGPLHSYPFTLGPPAADAAPEPPPKPGFEPYERFRDRLAGEDGGSGLEGPEMVYLPGGTFPMGDEQGDDDEQPVHLVRLDAFALARTPVTWGEYSRFCEATGSHWPEWLEKGSTYHLETGSGDYYRNRGIGPEALDLPVAGVSWEDAVAYCNWLSERTGETYRLPTEAEWEYACRAGGSTRWCFGDDEEKLGEYAWYSGNSDGKLHPVGQKLTNAWGIFDMHGNVWEWCADWYDSAYYGELQQSAQRGMRKYAEELQQPAASNPAGPADGSYRVVRGGAWSDDADHCRSAYRLHRHPTERDGNLGFRLSRTV